MKLVTDRPATQSARIYALERAREADNERLVKIEAKVDSVLDLLVRAKGAKALVDGTLKYIGIVASIGAAGVGIWKFILGH